MNFTNIKLTQNQQLLVNAFLSILASALVAAAQASYQYLTQHGLVNLQQLMLIFVGALWLSMSAAFIAYVPAHVQQELEALRQFQQQVTAQPSPVPAPPHVVIYAQGASVQSDTIAPPSARSMSTVAIPPRPVQLQTVTNEPIQQTAMAPQRVQDVLGDLPSSNGQPVNITQITGVVPTYGASGK